MAYGTLKADVIQSDTAGTPPQFNDGNGTQTGTLCRAWVQFAGASGTIAASFNVSSVTRTATGNFTVTFTNALADNKYSVSGAAGNGNGSGGVCLPNYQGLPTTTACYVATYSLAPAVTDYVYTTISVFR